MATITIKQKKYRELLEKAMRYDYLRQLLYEDIFSPPPTKDVKKILSEFRTTEKYTSQFLKSLGRGLKRSSYFHEDSPAS